MKPAESDHRLSNRLGLAEVHVAPYPGNIMLQEVVVVGVEKVRERDRHTANFTQNTMLRRLSVDEVLCQALATLRSGT